MNGTKRTRVVLNVVTGILALCAVLVATLRVRDVMGSAGQTDEAQPERLANWEHIGAEGARIGPQNAPVTIVEFSDFLCPFCRRAAVDLRELRRLFPTELAVVYRHFPVHDAAIPAAVAAECASRAGKFEAMHDALFDNAALIVAGSWSEFATKAGIADTVAFKECLDSKSAAQVVKRDMDLGAQLEVSGTPTFFLNDLRFARNPGWETMAEYVNRALGRDPHKTQR